MNDETLLRQALEALEFVTDEAYQRAGLECCNRPGYECCGSPAQVWNEQDIQIMDACGPVITALRARLAEKPAPVVTDAMVDAYLKAQSDYCVRADADIRVPMSPRLACREGLQAALAVDGLPGCSPEDSNG